MEIMNKTKIKSDLGIEFYKSLVKKYKSDIQTAKATLSVYFENPVGIGEHSELILEFDKHLTMIADAESKIETLEKYFDSNSMI